MADKYFSFEQLATFEKENVDFRQWSENGARIYPQILLSSMERAEASTFANRIAAHATTSINMAD